MGIRRDMRWAALLVVAAVAMSSAAASPAQPAGEGGGGSAEATEAGKRKCKKKPGQKLTKKQRKRCRVKKIPATLTVNCPSAPVVSGTAVSITGTLSPDSKGNSPLGAIWESSTAASSDGNQSFFTAPGGNYSFAFTSNAASLTTTTVRVDFAGDTLFADRRQTSAQCQFTTL